MAKVWFKDECPICGGTLYETDDVVLLASCKVTHSSARGSHSPGIDSVRPQFGARTPRVGVHANCLPATISRLLEN